MSSRTANLAGSFPPHTGYSANQSTCLYLLCVNLGKDARLSLTIAPSPLSLELVMRGSGSVAVGRPATRIGPYADGFPYLRPSCNVKGSAPAILGMKKYKAAFGRRSGTAPDGAVGAHVADRYGMNGAAVSLDAIIEVVGMEPYFRDDR